MDAPTNELKRSWTTVDVVDSIDTKNQLVRELSRQLEKLRDAEDPPTVRLVIAEPADSPQTGNDTGGE